MSAHERILTAAAPAPIGPYNQAIRAGDFIFCSGQIPLDVATGDLVPGDISAQTTQVLKNIAAVLAAANATFAHVVKTTIFLVDMNDFAAVNAVYSGAFGDGGADGSVAPARSTVAVAALPKNARVEIEVVARV